MVATPVSLNLLGAAPESLSAPEPELVEFWISRIPRVGPMLRELAARYPRTMERDSLASAIGMTASGGTFGTYLSRLSAAD
jgi:hypothetical protein